MTTNKTISKILDWQTHLTTKQAVLQGVSSTKKIHITEKMMLEAKAEATKAITQAMLDALPITNMVGYSGLCKTCEKPCDLDTCVCDGRNETILEIRTAIKKRGSDDTRTT